MMTAFCNVFIKAWGEVVRTRIIDRKNISSNFKNDSKPARMPSHEMVKGKKLNHSTVAPGVVNIGNRPRIKNSQRKA